MVGLKPSKRGLSAKVALAALLHEEGIALFFVKEPYVCTVVEYNVISIEDHPE